ncbi:MAG: leucine-rich repeat domain-containing protein, partial [Muribaculaceae bacterium]
MELTEAGSLSEKISEAQAASILSLTIKGHINGDDLSYLHQHFTAITKLDLAEAILDGGRFLCSKHKNFYEFAPNELAGHTLHIGNLNEVVLPVSVENVVVSSFADVDFGACSDRSEFTRMSGAFSGTLRCITVPDGNKHYSSHDGMLFDKAKTTLLKCPLSHSAEVSFPTSLKVISANAFRECNNIHEIVVPEGVTKIGEKAFYDSESLQKLTIPASVTTIDD